MSEISSRSEGDRAVTLTNARPTGTARSFPARLTPAQLADLLCMKLRTIYDLLERGKIPGAAKFGQQWRIDRDTVLACFQGNSAPNGG